MASRGLNISMECSSSGRGVALADALRRAHWPPRRMPAGAPRFAQPPAHVIEAASRDAIAAAGVVSRPAPQSASCGTKGRVARRQPVPPAQAAATAEGPSQTEPQTDLDKLNEEWGIEGAVEFGVGQGGLPTCLLTHPQTGMQLVVYLYGATIAQWIKQDGTATFYDGPDELYEPGVPLKTGVSLHFPQHREGVLPQHGFADSMLWEVDGAGFNCPELLQAAEARVADLLGRGVITIESVAAAEAGGEAEAALRAAVLADGPPPPHEALTDMAPFVTLRLRSSDATRALWPHDFELLYTITLCVQDNMDELDMAGYERLQVEAAARAVLDAAAEAGEPEDDGEPAKQPAAPAAEAPQPPKKARGRPRKEAAATDEDLADPAAAAAAAAAAQGDDEEEGGEEDGSDGSGGDGSDGDVAAAAAAAAGAPRTRARQLAEAAAAAADVLGEEHDEEGAIGPEPWAPGVQIRQEFVLRNLDPAGSPPMRFQLASLARFVTMSQAAAGDWVRVLGLAGGQTFDYTEDPRSPTLDLAEDDFLHFRGQRHDVTYIDAADASVYLCPGNRTHYEFIQRAGFRDMLVEQPGVWAGAQYDRVVAMGTGYVASSKKLAPGGTWRAESVIRYHKRLWRQPIFGDATMSPLPPIPKDQLETAGDEDDAYGGLPSDPSAGGE